MKETAEDVQRFILAKCKKLVDRFDPKEVIHSFSGIRAKSDRNDWIIERSAVQPNFVNVAGIDSPGLAGCPAIALEVVRLLREDLKLEVKRDFNPNRSAIIVPKVGFRGLKMSKYEDRFSCADAKQNVVCKCEKVTEAEVVDALHRSLPVDSTQAIRKRTRAGMGHCQVWMCFFFCICIRLFFILLMMFNFYQGDPDNYNCECRVAEIISRELNVPIELVGRRPWPATSTLKQRWLSPEQKLELVELSK
jgi:glycerol-3-phosphate dehydrogenase